MTPEARARICALVSFFIQEVKSMPGARQPTDLIVAKGRKHLSRSAEAERRAGELKVPKAKTSTKPARVAAG